MIIILLLLCTTFFNFIETICDDCSDIIINHQTNPPEVELCTGENISIAIKAPPIFNISEDYFGASLRLGISNLECDSKCCPVGDVTAPSVVYECRNMQEIDSGIYFGHNLFSCASDTFEWCTQNVSVKVKNCSNDINGSTLSTTVAQPSSSVYTDVSNQSLSKCVAGQT